MLQRLFEKYAISFSRQLLRFCDDVTVERKCDGNSKTLFYTCPWVSGAQARMKNEPHEQRLTRSDATSVPLTRRAHALDWLITDDFYLALALTKLFSFLRATCYSH